MIKSILNLFCFLIIISESALAAVPRPSTAKNFESFDNVHEVLSANILRGSTPNAAQIPLMIKEGVTDILIFKKETTDEVQTEIFSLQQQGLPKQQITHIPAEWRTSLPFQTTCRQYVKALQLMTEIASSPQRRLYFHCTAGQDRTSVLAGLFRVLHGDDISEVFRHEMCDRGFEAGGGPTKPFTVVRTVRKNLTPFFLTMATLLQKEKVTPTSLTTKICDSDLKDLNLETPNNWICK